MWELLYYLGFISKEKLERIRINNEIDETIRDIREYNLTLTKEYIDYVKKLENQVIEQTKEYRRLRKAIK